MPTFTPREARDAARLGPRPARRRARGPARLRRRGRPSARAAGDLRARRRGGLERDRREAEADARARAPAPPAAPARGGAARGRLRRRLDPARLGAAARPGGGAAGGLGARRRWRRSPRKYEPYAERTAARPAAAADASSARVTGARPAARGPTTRSTSRGRGAPAPSPATSAASTMHAGGHARAAVGHELAAGRRARGLEARAQLVGREEAAVGRELGEGQVDGAGDVARHRVDRLDLAAVALGRAGVEEERAAASASAPRRSHRPRRAAWRSKRSRIGLSSAPAASGPPSAAPAAQAAVEHGHVARGRSAAAATRAGRRLPRRPRRRPRPACPRRCRPGGRPPRRRPAPAAGGVRRSPGSDDELAVEVEEGRARDVAVAPEPLAGARLAQLEAAVDHAKPRLAEPLAQPGGGHERAAHAPRMVTLPARRHLLQDPLAGVAIIVAGHGGGAYAA